MPALLVTTAAISNCIHVYDFQREELNLSMVKAVATTHGTVEEERYFDLCVSPHAPATATTTYIIIV